MPTVNIVDPGNSGASVAITPAFNNDFVYGLPRSGERWLGLWYDNSPSPGFETPGMYRSTDGGATWTRHGDASAPVLSFHFSSAPPLAFDSRFNTGDPAARSSITIFYVDDSLSGPTWSCNLVDFNFTSKTYGAPYGALSLDNLTIRSWGFSSLPAGGLILVYSKFSTDGTYFRIYNAGWGAETLLDSDSSGFVNLIVDGSGNSHILVDSSNYYRLSPSGTVLEGPTAIHSTGKPQNLSLIGGNLKFLVVDSTSSFVLFTGSPASGPVVWSSETIAGVDVPNEFGVASYAELSSDYFVNLELFGSTFDYTVDFAMPSITGPAIHWPNAAFTIIYRAVKSAGTWGAPVAIWNTSGPGTVRGVSSVFARGASLSANRYRPIW